MNLLPFGTDRLVDFGIFLGYGFLLFQTVRSWFRLRHINRKRHVNLLSVLVVLMTVCVMLFISANYYMLEVMGQTLLSIRVFQVFVLCNGIVYWLVLSLIKREVDDERTAGVAR